MKSSLKSRKNMIAELSPKQKETLIQPNRELTLQQQITEVIRNGCQRIFLEGTFSSQNEKLFSPITISQNNPLEIIGHKATISGEDAVAHLLFLGDYARLKVSGVTFTGGNTGSVEVISSLKNHPNKKLNIFRYLDGAAVTMGVGSELLLEKCIFFHNHSAICGGAISNLGGCLHVRNCTFMDNSCGDTGAAIDNLAQGSLTVIEHCRFLGNTANQLGTGNFGAVTAFPNTYLVVRGSDFSGQLDTAIDYRMNRGSISYVSIHSDCIFNNNVAQPIVRNPLSNRSVRKEILQRYLRLFIQHPGLVKLEGIPDATGEVKAKHKQLFLVQ